MVNTENVENEIYILKTAFPLFDGNNVQEIPDKFPNTVNADNNVVYHTVEEIYQCSFDCCVFESECL